MIYPHIISNFQTDTKCDFCKDKMRETYTIAKNIGYYHCQSKDCIEKLNNNIDTNVISIQKLKDKFGNNVKVKRQNGNIESDWYLSKNGYKLNNKSNYIIEIKKGHISKQISYDDLEKLNS